METRQKGRAFIKSFESLRLRAYPDPGIGEEPYTIGWGHTGGVKPGGVITREQAEAFNIGRVAFTGSTLVRKFNAGELMGAADQFPRWKFSGGKVMPGLVRRRTAEREMFLPRV